VGTKFDNCLTCNEMKAIAARGLCYKCYRAEERSRERATPDRHNPGMRREHKKILKAFSSIMVGLADMGCVRDDIFDIRKILQPYLEPIEQYLNLNAPEPPPEETAPDPEPPDDPPPSEQKPESRSPFTAFTFYRPGTDPEPGQKKPSKKIHTMPK
jgi:hypothetical protein